MSRESMIEALRLLERASTILKSSEIANLKKSADFLRDTIQKSNRSLIRIVKK